MLKNVRLSLKDLLGEDYIASVCAANAFLSGRDESALRALAEEKADLWPEDFARRQEELMEHVGRPPVPMAGRRTIRPPPSARWARSAWARTEGCISPARASIIRSRSGTPFRAGS